MNRVTPLNAPQQTPHVVENASPTLLPIPTVAPVSDIRRVFQTTDQMKTEFVKFLQTIFYQLDDQKVLEGMERLLSDPTKTDEQIYRELSQNIGGMKRRFAGLWQLWSLGVLKEGMGKQAAQLVKNFEKGAFRDYMEIYDRRYLNDIRKIAKLALNGNTIAVCDRSDVTFADRLQAGVVLRSYPYQTHISLNDPDCQNPLEQPEKTHKPIGDEVPDNSLDFIACLGGLHHIPRNKVEDFVASLSKKLRPGGVILLRDHNVAEASGSAQLPKDDLRAIAAVVHTFVNAEGAVSWEVENKEIREFKSVAEWRELMARHQFTSISPDVLVLKDDPTENGMFAFVKTPQNLEEMRQAIAYRSDCTRPKDGTRATWIEWGNVRFSKQYAEFVQDHHSYAFDYIGHLRQHWQYFTTYISESRNDGVSLKNLIFSDNFAMNLFILFATAIQCAAGYIASLPSQLVARWKHGENWREVSNLTDLEKFEARVEKEYSTFIDHTPFYMFDYFGKIRQLWSTIANSQESWTTRVSSVLSAIPSTLGFLAKGIVSAPVRAIYTAEGNVEPDTIKVLLKDPDNELPALIQRWEAEKDPVHDKNHKIEVVYDAPDGHKLVSVPRYRPFTTICGYLTAAHSLELLEVGSQRGITVDVRLGHGVATPQAAGARVVYEMDKLQDAQQRRYATYHVDVPALKVFQQTIGTQHIEYIHE